MLNMVQTAIGGHRTVWMPSERKLHPRCMRGCHE
jgi:hypothetical protein